MLSCSAGSKDPAFLWIHVPCKRLTGRERNESLHFCWLSQPALKILRHCSNVVCIKYQKISFRLNIKTQIADSLLHPSQCYFLLNTLYLLCLSCNIENGLFSFIISCGRNVPIRQSNRESSGIWLTEEEEVIETEHWSLSVATANILI